MDGTAASPGNIVSHEDRVDGNASDNDNTDLEDYTNNNNSDYEEDLWKICEIKMMNNNII